MELGHLGDQRGYLAVSADGHGRANRLGKESNCLACDRDRERDNRESKHPRVSGSQLAISARTALTTDLASALRVKAPLAHDSLKPGKLWQSDKVAQPHIDLAHHLDIDHSDDIEYSLARNSSRPFSHGKRFTR